MQHHDHAHTVLSRCWRRFVVIGSRSTAPDRLCPVTDRVVSGNTPQSILPGQALLILHPWCRMRCEAPPLQSFLPSAPISTQWLQEQSLRPTANVTTTLLETHGNQLPSW